VALGRSADPGPTPGSNVVRDVFGALNIRTGQWSYLVREHMYKEDFIVFLEHLLAVYTTGVVILIVDNYSSHTACVVQTCWRSTLGSSSITCRSTAHISTGREHLAPAEGPDRCQSLVRLHANAC